MSSSIHQVGAAFNISGGVGGLSSIGPAAYNQSLQDNLKAQPMSSQGLTFGSMEELKAKEPKIYDAILSAFANNVRATMQAANNRITEELRKHRRS